MTKKAKENKETHTTSKTNTTKKQATKKNTKNPQNEKKEKISSTIKKTTKSTKSSSTPKNKTHKTTSKKTTKVKNTINEYYDLPNKYNQTTVKILAQTPKTLFIYWEISDDDTAKYKKQYGENFFEKTKPVLIIHNNTLNYSFEVEINDYSNSWYLPVKDSKCNYNVELGRRPIEKNNKINSDYLYISSSNKIESPNDHILYNTSQKMIYFRNIKSNQKIEKPTTSLSFIQNLGKIYNIYDIYKELYKNQDDFEKLSNPSSQFK